MKRIKLMCVALILLGLIPASSVWARGGHNHGGGGHNHHRHHHGGGYGGYGLALGLGLLGGYGLGYYGNRTPYYPPASYGYAPRYGYGNAYGYPPAVTVPAAPPPVYIQQEIVQVAPQARSVEYWHYCRNPEGYYPYVKSCPEGWMQVVPQPSAR